MSPLLDSGQTNNTDDHHVSLNSFDVTLDHSCDWPDSSDVVSSPVFEHVC